MGRIRRHGYVLEWFIGDHAPRHVHIYDSKGRFIGRLALDNMTGMKGWKPGQDVIQLIQELKKEGRL